MDRHRAGGKAIFINLYLFTALFFLALNFKFFIALTNFLLAHVFHNRSSWVFFLLSVAAFNKMPVGMLLK